MRKRGFIKFLIDGYLSVNSLAYWVFECLSVARTTWRGNLVGEVWEGGGSGEGMHNYSTCMYMYMYMYITIVVTKLQ